MIYEPYLHSYGNEPNKSPWRKRLWALLHCEIGHLSSPSRSCLRSVFLHPWRNRGAALKTPGQFLPRLSNINWPKRCGLFLGSLLCSINLDVKDLYLENYKILKTETEDEPWRGSSVRVSFWYARVAALIPSQETYKNQPMALAGVASWIEHKSANQRVASTIPGRSTCLGCGGQVPSWRHMRGNHTSMFLSLSPSLSLS